MPDHVHIETARRVLQLEADALGQLSRGLDERFVKAVETILAAKGRVICTGIGKSGHVARKIAATMASTGTQAYFVHATEASHGDLGMIGQDDVVLALSKSGETKELADMLSYAKRYSIPLIGMTAKADSTLGRAADILLQVPDAAEACAETNAPTTSTTLMIALGDALAVALLESKGFKADHFKVFHPGGKLGAMLRTAADVMHKSAELPLVAAGTPFIDAVKSMTGKGFGVLGVTSAGWRARRPRHRRRPPPLSHLGQDGRHHRRRDDEIPAHRRARLARRRRPAHHERAQDHADLRASTPASPSASSTCTTC